MSKFSTEKVRHSRAFEREDVLNEFFHNSKQTQHLRRRSRQRVSTIEDLTHHNLVRLNKKVRKH